MHIFTALYKYMYVHIYSYIQTYFYLSKPAITATLWTVLVVSGKIIMAVGLVVKCLLNIYGSYSCPENNTLI